MEYGEFTTARHTAGAGGWPWLVDKLIPVCAGRGEVSLAESLLPWGREAAG